MPPGVAGPRRFPPGRLAAGLIVLPLWLFAAAVATPHATAGTAAVPPALPEATDTWLEARSPHFTVLSNAGAGKTRSAARELESLRAVLARITTGIETGSSRPTMVYLFRNEKSFRPYKDRKEMEGYFTRGMHANLLAANADAPGNPRAVWYHEFIHDVLARNYEVLPLWFNEGMAEFYTTFECDEKEAFIGRPVAGHIYWLRQHDLIPLKSLFGITPSSPEYNETSKQGVFYAESWALVHYLMHGNEARRPQTSRFLKLLNSGVAAETAFAQAFTTDYDGLEKELKTYISRSAFTYAHYTFADLAIPAVEQPRAVERAELLFRLGDLLLWMNDESAPRAEQHFRAALEQSPGHAGATADLGLVYSRQGRPEEASRLFEQALAAAPRDPAICHLAAASLLERITGRSEGSFDLPDEPPEDARRARVMLEKCRDLAPDDPSVQADLGLTYLLLRDPDPSPGIEALERARRALPMRSDILLNLVALYAQNGERRKAEEIIQLRLKSFGDPEQMRQARESLLRIELKQVSEQLERGELEDGLEALRSVASRTARPEVKAAIEAEIPKIEAAIARKREIAAYDAAVGMIRSGDTAGAVAALKTLTASCTSEDVCREARSLLGKLTEPRQPGKRD